MSSTKQTAKELFKINGVVSVAIEPENPNHIIAEVNKSFNKMEYLIFTLDNKGYTYELKNY